jgi:hypothetical protein
MNPEQPPIDPGVEYGRVIGQRRAFAAVAGRCSAAHAQLLRRIRDEKLYLPVAPSWRAFCGAHLAITRRHADRIIAILNRFGPIYFELSELIGISPRQYLAIEPALREQGMLGNGETISLIPENAPQVLEAVGELLRENHRPLRRVPAPETLRQRVIDLTSRCRELANQLVALYYECSSGRDREFILESATELRMILMQPGID